MNGWYLFGTLVAIGILAPVVGAGLIRLIVFLSGLWNFTLDEDAAYQHLSKKLAANPKSRAARKAVKDALFRANGRVRLLAALNSGTEGDEALSEIMQDHTLSSKLRCAAFQGLAERTKTPRNIWKLIEAGLASGSTALRVLTIAEARKHKGVLSLERLAAMKNDGAGVAAEAAKSLADFSEADAEAALIAFLERDEDPVRLAAIDALGKIGTRECVEKILPYTEGLLADGDVKKAAREAVERIQSRLGNVGAGRISVVDSFEETGRISVAEIPGEAGRIAVAEESSEKRFKIR